MSGSTFQFNASNFPDISGIYLFYNNEKELIYVGKATSLKNRVQSYFRIQRATRPIESMMHEVVSIDYKTTDSVLEAVILEAQYIKTYVPKYNVLGKDNRSWNYFWITKDLYPKVKTFRQHEYQIAKKDKNFDETLFGPYPGLNTTAALKILRSLFRFSSCTPPMQENFSPRPCFYYQIDQCLGVCLGKISPAEYKRKVIEPLILFLKGKKKILIQQLERKMQRASKEENFEEASRLRDQLKSLSKIQDINLINRDMVEVEQAQLSKQNQSHFFVDRIEGYDISNLGITGKVGSMVVFDSVQPVKSQYRRFKIRTVEGQSDVDCLEEILQRRFGHTEWPLPQVVLIDGGLPQVNRAERVLEQMGVLLPLVGIAKGRDRKKNQFIFPVSWGKGLGTEKNGLSRSDFVLWVNENKQLLIQVRDEAHRFAIAYQRSTRKLQ